MPRGTKKITPAIIPTVIPDAKPAADASARVPNFGKFEKREEIRITVEPKAGPAVTAKKKDKQLISLQVDIELLNDAKNIAKRRGNTITSVLNDALREYVKENTDLL